MTGRPVIGSMLALAVIDAKLRMAAARAAKGSTIITVMGPIQ